MDETTIFSNMYPKKAKAKKCNKTILIKKQSQEKCEIICNYHNLIFL